jgi:hypothetical protein
VKSREEMIAFYAERSNDLLRSLGRVGPELRLQNSHHAYLCQCMVGLLIWRGGSNPTEALSKALAVAELVPANYEVAGFPYLWVNFDVASAGLLAILLEVEVPASLKAVLPSEDLILRATREYSAQALSLSLTAVLMGRSQPEFLDAVLSAVPKIRRLSLLRETFECYRDLLDPDGTYATFIERVRHAESLFLRRKRSDYFSGGRQVDGGGPDNDFVVDYRLAAILKTRRYFENSDGGVISSHQFRWQRTS